MFNNGNIGEEEEIAVWFSGFKSSTMRFLAKYFPWFLIGLSRLMQRKYTERAEKLHSVLEPSQRIDLIPSKHGTRAFTLLIDQQTALYFHQDGDKFVYDGWGVGNFLIKGKVTVFDNYKDDE